MMFQKFLDSVSGHIAEAVSEGFRRGFVASGFKLHYEAGAGHEPYLAPKEQKAKPRRGGKIDARRVKLRKIDPKLKAMVDERMKFPSVNGDGQGDKPAA